MKLKLDAAMLRTTTQDAARRLRAVRQTVEKAGGGEVLVSKRAKIAGEKGRAMHGRAIANMLADRGHDVFGYPSRVEERAAERVAQGTALVIQRAWATGQQQQRTIRDLFTATAGELASWARANILAGGLGTVAKSTLIAKRRLVSRGRALAAYVSTYGVRTKRFADGVRHRWRGGRRP